MEKNYLFDLKNIDTNRLAFDIANRLQGNEDQRDFHRKGIAIAYALYSAAKDESVCIDNKDDFMKSLDASDTVKDVLSKSLSVDWSVITDLAGKYSADELLSYILFNNSLEDYRTGDSSTPSGLIKLVCSLLGIEKNEKVVELCSGKGNFFVEAFAMHDEFEYTGIELNYIVNDIAKIRAEVLGKSINLVLSDALEYRNETKADKLFANYPFMIKTPAMSEHKERIREAFGIPADVVQRASSDWIFNATLFEQMDEKGKAVAIMTNGATWNTPDKNIRKFFIENGYIEAVISLPARLFNNTNISTTLIVFSHNNKEVKLIDACEIYEKERRNNILTDASVNEILSLLDNDGNNAVTKSLAELAENDYILNASRYLEVLPEIKNGVEFGSVIKNITRGAQLKASDLEKMKSFKATQFKYLTLANINDGILSFDEEQYLKEIPENMKKYCVSNNSIVLTRTGMPAFKSAVAQVEPNTALLATGNLYVIELDETKVNPFYLQAFFASDTGILLFKSICSGAGLPIISLDKLKKLTVPLPSIEEQIEVGNKYAATMDEIILLKRRLEKSVAKIKHIYDGEV